MVQEVREHKNTHFTSCFTSVRGPFPLGHLVNLHLKTNKQTKKSTVISNVSLCVCVCVVCVMCVGKSVCIHPRECVMVLSVLQQTLYKVVSNVLLAASQEWRG